MTSRVPCRFYAQGRCTNGAQCTFLHEKVPPTKKSPGTSVCINFQSGYCQYGRNCWFAHSQAPGESTEEARRDTVSERRTAASKATAVPVVRFERGPSAGAAAARLVSGPRGGVRVETGWRVVDDDEGTEHTPAAAEREQAVRSFAELVRPAAAAAPADGDSGDAEMSEWSQAVWPPLPAGDVCRFHAKGQCWNGDACRFVHGDRCPRCQQHCLHPLRAELREAHERTCAEAARVDEERRASAAVVCGICGEQPMSKQCRFGLLSGCEHAFCLECIREWRSSRDVALTTARACPVCRSLAYFVVPCDRYLTGTRKADAILRYRARLSRIPCMHFDYGRGQCPFGSECFYAHRLPDGGLVQPDVRRLVGGDERVRVDSGIRLADFL